MTPLSIAYLFPIFINIIMCQEIFNIFNGTTATQVITKYLDFIQNLQNVIGESSVLSKKVVDSLLRICDSSDNVCKVEVLPIIRLMHKGSLRYKRITKLCYMLGEMACYWSIKEYSNVISIQNEVLKVKYVFSFWEKFISASAESLPVAVAVSSTKQLSPAARQGIINGTIAATMINYASPNDNVKSTFISSIPAYAAAAATQYSSDAVRIGAINGAMMGIGMADSSKNNGDTLETIFNCIKDAIVSLQFNV